MKIITAGLHGKVLDLAARLDIATDVAHAVTYLHMYTGLSLIFHFNFIKILKFLIAPEVKTLFRDVTGSCLAFCVRPPNHS